jgi:hypothetical protein
MIEKSILQVTLMKAKMSQSLKVQLLEERLTPDPLLD